MGDQGAIRSTLKKYNEKIFRKSDLGLGPGVDYVSTAMYTQIINYSNAF
jgi:hypothetical protein